MGGCFGIAVERIKTVSQQATNGHCLLSTQPWPLQEILEL